LADHNSNNAQLHLLRFEVDVIYQLADCK